jgi:hypothetical protein
MNSIENKNIKKISVETHKRVIEIPEAIGIKTPTLYKDLEFLKISTIKDDNNLSWITNEDFKRVLLLRKHLEINGRRTGFDETKMSELVLAEEANITNTKKSEISNQEIYVTPEDPKENMDVDNIVRKGAELKAREIAMPHLVVRAIADKLDESELPEDLQEKIEDAREASNPKFTPEDVADSILMNYRKNLA